MFFSIIAFAVGDWIVGYLPQIPSLRFCITLLLFFLILTALAFSFKRVKSARIILNILVIVSFGLSGFVWSAHHARQWLKAKLDPQWAGKVIAVTGVISGLPQDEQVYTRFLLTTQKFELTHERKRLQLIWEKPHPPLRPGDQWHFNVRLKPPHSLMNFNNPNSLRYWWNENIHAGGYVDSRRDFNKIGVQLSLMTRLQRLRQNLQEEINRVVKDRSHAAIIHALTIGQEQGLREEDWRILQRTGTVHLVVIAGLHIGLMVMIAYCCAAGVWRFFPALLRRWPAQKAGALAALIFALMYGALAGFNIPAQRAVIMCMITMLGQIFCRSSPVHRRIALAGFLVLIFQPNAINTASFWLSFAAVAWIAYATEGEHSILRWRQWLKIQAALFLGLAPLTIYYFQQYSLVSLIANPPAIIWIGWGVVPACLLAAALSHFFLSAGENLFQLAGWLITPLWQFLQWLASWPWSGGQRVCYTFWPLLLAEIGMLWFLMPRKLRGRWLGLGGLMPLFLLPAATPAPGDFWVSVLDVGQGLAVIVQTARHLLVYDTGPRIPGGFDAGRDVVSPYLTWLGVNTIDKMIISHGDNDHSGGALALLSAWKIPELLTSVPAMFKNSPAQHCLAGVDWEWDGVPFRLLSPIAPQPYQGNNSSCVLQIGKGRQRLLLSGDIEKETEEELVQRYGVSLQSSVLIAPHHGSKTSSTLGFLEKVQPQQVIFSLGYFNRFHFPSPSVLSRYQGMRIHPWSTARDGAILIKFTQRSGAITLTPANSHHFFWQN